MKVHWPPREPPFANYITAPPRLAAEPRALIILGSTGSIGKNAIDVVAHTSEIKICGLACNRNIQGLAAQARKFRPPYLAVGTEALAQNLRTLLPRDYTPTIYTGMEGYATLAEVPEAGWVLSCQAGSAGLAGTLAAAQAGKNIALANKETLVMAGTLLRRVCAHTHAAILPVDSEHFAIFQCLSGRPGADVKKLILTASGGPFRGWDAKAIYNAIPKQALKHPNWNMGAKITVDSATLMNKGLEFIEAMHLYGMPAEEIDILVHPQSIVHSMVEFKDNGQLAQMAVPDMRLPIASCLLWPHAEAAFVPPLDLTTVGALTFEKPDFDSFPCLALAITAAQWVPPRQWQDIGVNPACLVLNGANEMAVESFLQGKCTFGQIPELIGSALDALVYGPEMRQNFTLPNAGDSMDIAQLFKCITQWSNAARNWVKNLLAAEEA